MAARATDVRRANGVPHGLVIALLGGTFDPPHNGHVALARAVVDQFAPERLVILVAARPGHKDVELDADTRLGLAQAAFPGEEVVLDEQERTVDTLAHGPWRDPLFVIGADEFCDFLTWTDPNGVLERARLAVATRPGYPRERLDAVLERLEHPERVLFFEIEPLPISSRDLRDRIGREEPIGDLVPPAVAELVSQLRLYRDT
jgi:nicotinate-nucleotide adenylyltransferase